MRMRHIIASALVLLATPAAAADITFNGITITCPWTEATRTGVTIAPVYMNIRTSAAVADRLSEAISDLSERIEIYTYARIAGVLQRQPLPNIAIDPGVLVQLQPGGLHLLMVELKEPIVADIPFKIWVKFDNAGGFEVELDVVPIGGSPACGRAPAGGGPAPGPRPLPLPLPLPPRGSF